MTSGGPPNSLPGDNLDNEVGSDDLRMDLEDLLNPDEQRRFRRLCIDTSAEDLDQLGEVIELHLDQVKANAKPATDIETAELVGQAALKVLSFSDQFDAQERAMVRGAVEYFILNDDASDDLDDALGFDDDARVLNSVLDRIGRSELKVELQS